MKHSQASVVLAAALLLAACGGEAATQRVASLESPGAPTSATEPSGQVSMEEGLIAFTECLREQGLDVGDPVVGPDGNLQMPPIALEGEAGDQAEMDAVFREMDAKFAKCEPLLGEVMFTNDDLPDFNEFEDLLVEYAACMREKGIDMPDPDFSSGGGMVELMIDPTDSRFQAADEACRDILGSLGGMEVSVDSAGG